MMQLSQSFFRPKRWFAANERLGNQIVKIASSLVILIGCLVFMGWVLNLGILKSGMVGGLVTMKANTAICFVLAGISLNLQARKLSRQSQGSNLVRIANGCATAIVIIAALTLCQYLFGWNFGIDQLLFRDVATASRPYPGRMGINTAINFCLVGISLGLINGAERRSPNQPQHQVKLERVMLAQILATAAGAIAIQCLIGHLYEVPSFYPVNGAMTSMATHTALSFIVLNVGILALKCAQGFMRALTSDLLGSNMARRLIPLAILIPPLTGWWILQGRRQNLYDPNFAFSLMAMSTMGISLGLIWQNTGILNRIDYARTQAKEQIQASEERLRLALKGAKEGIWDWDLQTQAITWNDRCKELFGFPLDTLVTLERCLNRIHPDDRPQVVEATEIALHNCGEFDLEYRIIGADDTIRWIHGKGSCYPDSTGEPYRMLGTMLDITSRKQAQLNEQFLHDLTRRLRHFSNPDEIQWEATKSLGKYLNVDGATWCEIDWKNRLATIHRTWHREGLGLRPGVYLLADFLSPALQASFFAGESVAIADVATDPYTAAYSENYRHEDVRVRAFASIPCINEDQWVASLHVTTKTVRTWRDDEVALMEAVVARLWSFIEEARAVQALREQERQTRAAQAIVQQQLGEIEAIYQNAPIGLCFVDTDLRYVRINELLAQINGSLVSEHIGRTFREILPELADSVEPLYQQVIESGEPIIDLEVSGTNRAQPGVERQWLASFYPQTDAEECVIGVNTVVQEITERKQIEAALKASERNFSAIFEQSFELMGIVSLDGVLLEVNQTALDSIEARKEDIAGRLFWETPWWHTPELRDQLKAAIDRAAKGEFCRYEVQFPHPSGVMLTTDFSLKPVFDESGDVATIVAEAHDITDRKRAERDLQESQERLQAGIEVAGVGLARFDYTTNLVALSPEAAVLYGFDPDTTFVTREQIHDTFHPDQRTELEAIIAQVLDPAGTGWFAKDHRVLWPNGEVRCLSVNKQVFFDRSGAVHRPTHGILAAIDITDRNRIQAELEDRNQELDSFVHIVSHDLKAPLRAISNLSQWIEEDSEGLLPAESQANMELLRARVQRMEAMIDGLLEFARIGRTDGSIESVVVSELLAETIRTLAPPPAFTISFDSNLPTFRTNRILLAQVFANLIGNAIKHHDRGDGTVHVGITERSDCYEFAIADDGPGIDPVYHERVFGIFQAVNPQNRPDSSGVGLAIVKKIVEAEGGTIRLESQPGQGTTFYFTWPKRS
jgi:PAS domain S-box-containing protein